MTAIESAIKEAVEKGGYKRPVVITVGEKEIYDEDGYQTFLDPLFWQALGKSRGWGKKTLSNGLVANVGRDGYINVWHSYWHDFIDHLAEGKDAESFFKDL